MQTTPFVRGEMLTAKPAPSTSAGPVAWVRKYLFNSPLNTVLTLGAILVIYMILSGIVPWFMHSVWTADSLEQCRQIIRERYGEGVSGACWAVIHERFPQLVYGFYPPELYWRPNLTFVLLLVALAPILFTALPRQMLYFSIAFPFLGAWLLWGGSLWGPLMAFAALPLAVLAYRMILPMNGILAVLAAFLVPAVWWIALVGPLSGLLASVIPLAIEPVSSSKFGGFMVSITIGITAISASLPLGIILALGRQTNLWLMRTFSVIFIEFIRGVPLITLLFVASTLLNYFMPPGTNFDLIVRVIIMATLFTAAYLAEVIRGGLAALPKGQYEAADSLGLTYWQAQRFIIMPQALKIAIPGIVSTFISLFKDTTLVSIIGVLDPLGLTNAIRANAAWHGIYWELFVFIGAVFFVFCFSMSRYSMYLERKLNTGHR